MNDFWQWLRCKLGGPCPTPWPPSDSHTAALQAAARRANRQAAVFRRARIERRLPTADELVRAGGLTRDDALFELWGRPPWEDAGDDGRS